MAKSLNACHALSPRPRSPRGPRWLLITAALLGCTGVGLAAYTSHGLGFIADPVAREAARATLQQAVQQQLLHAVVLLALGVWARQGGSRWLHLAALLLTLGVLLFSGLIYLRIFTGLEALRPLVPWGGTSLMLGWLAIGAAALDGRQVR